MLSIILLVFAAAAAAPAVARATRQWAGTVLGLIPAAAFAWALGQVAAVTGGGTLDEVEQPLPAIGKIGTPPSCSTSASTWW